MAGRAAEQTNSIALTVKASPTTKTKTPHPDRRGNQLSDPLHRTPSLLGVADLAHDHATLHCQLKEMISTEADCHQGNELRERAHVTNDEERIEPSGHEEEIQNPRGKHERADQPPNLALLLYASDQGNQINQHPHGTRIEPVREAHERRKR